MEIKYYLCSIYSGLTITIWKPKRPYEGYKTLGHFDCYRQTVIKQTKICNLLHSIKYNP